MIIVAGPGRCGTSAVTAALSELEPTLSLPTDLYPADHNNPRGYYESLSLSMFMHKELSSHATFEHNNDWWTRVPHKILSKAHRLFHNAFPLQESKTYLWKAPALTWALPFWAHHFNVRPSALVIVTRPIQEVISSMRDFPLRPTNDEQRWNHVIKQWGRALSSAAHLSTPVVVLDYPTLIERPKQFWESIQPLRDITGLAFDGEAVSVDAALRRHR